LAIQESTEKPFTKVASNLLKYLTNRKKQEMIRLSDYVSQDLVVFLPQQNRDEALQTLVKKLQEKGKVQNKDSFYQAILEREKIVSTGIGMGVAIPHAKLANLNEFFLVIGIQKEQGIEWDTIDYNPVKLIFMIGGPDNEQTKYIQILSSLTYLVKKEEFRSKLLQAKSTEEVVNLFSNH